MIGSKGYVSCYLGNTNNRSGMNEEEIRRSFGTFIWYERKSFDKQNFKGTDISAFTGIFTTLLCISLFFLFLQNTLYLQSFLKDLEIKWVFVVLDWITVRIIHHVGIFSE